MHIAQCLFFRGDVEKAVKEFCKYSRKFKITPCRQQLTYAVLDKPDLLDEVYQSSVLVRGKVDAKHHIAFAKSDVGDLDGAAKILSVSCVVEFKITM